jgi:molybdopterin-guanine dinucleotide biosynthesis protein A
MMNKSGFGVVVQAGGESRRMGRDKALMPFLGLRLIERVIDRVSPIADELLVITNHPEAFEFLKLPLHVDIRPGKGALGGLYTALQISNYEFVAVVACDMPFINSSLLVALRDMIIQEDYDAAIPKTSQGLEPFHAVYRRSKCLPAVEAALDKGSWKMDSWLSDVKIRYVLPGETAFLDPLQLAFWNLNTPDDFNQAELLAKIEADQAEGGRDENPAGLPGVS